METIIYIDEKLGYCEVNEKTEIKIKNYLIDKIIQLEININDGMEKPKWVDIHKIKKTYKKLSINGLKEIVGDLEYFVYYKKNDF